MSGAAAAEALQARFDEVLKSEWTRLGRKVSGLDEGQRQAVESIVAQVVHALADRPARTLTTTNEPALGHLALRLFGARFDQNDVSVR